MNYVLFSDRLNYKTDWFRLYWLRGRCRASKPSRGQLRRKFWTGVAKAAIYTTPDVATGIDYHSIACSTFWTDGASDKCAALIIGRV